MDLDTEWEAARSDYSTVATVYMTMDKLLYFSGLSFLIYMWIIIIQTYLTLLF